MKRLILLSALLLFFSPASPAFAADEHDHPPVSPPPCRAPIPYNEASWDDSTCYPTAGSVRDVVEGITGGETTIMGQVDINSHTDATVVLTAADCYGDINLNGDDDAIDFTLPVAAAGLVCCFDAYLYSQVITVDPADGADTIILNGVALTAGYAIDSGGVAGEQFCLIGLDATYWRVINGTATISDGGAD